MAVLLTLTEATPHSLLYAAAEDGTAQDVIAHDPSADLIDGPLKDLLSPVAGFADQAAANDALVQAADISSHIASGTIAAAPPALAIAGDVSAPAVAGNFRLAIGAKKALPADTAGFFVRISYRHSMVD